LAKKERIESQMGRYTSSAAGRVTESSRNLANADLCILLILGCRSALSVGSIFIWILSATTLSNRASTMALPFLVLYLTRA
jgi:hypothetical protein